VVGQGSENNGGATAVTTLSGDPASGLLLLCDHASNALPPAYGRLGLPASELSRHIAYDIGAAGVVHALSRRLDATAILSGFSRLLIDCNRGVDDPTLIMRLSDGAIVPGNRVLDDHERQHRISSFYKPYHRAIALHIDHAIAGGHPPLLISIHSFTPEWRGVERPWHVGVLWDRDPRLARLLLAAFRADPRLVVGDNQPYTGALHGDCLWQHGTQRGLAHAIIEIRQDLIAETAGQIAWSERIASIVSAQLDDRTTKAELTTVQHFGSLTNGS
jgi:predicted N-formylglutamate amidohydrolase